MCRFLILKSKSNIILADIITRPDLSLIRQSYECKERLESDGLPPSLNADGFGVGWFSEDSVCNRSSHDTLHEESVEEEKCCLQEPVLFHSTTPAWSNRNLARLCARVRSRLVFAHVRAATAGTWVTESNCHPFSVGQWMWMHNGGIRKFSKMKQKLVSQLPEFAYNIIEGTTDSEHAFAVFLACLSDLRSPKADDGINIEDMISIKRSRSEIVRCMEMTISRIIGLARESGCGLGSLLNFAVTDGHSVVVSRFVDNACTDLSTPVLSLQQSGQTLAAASMYFSAGTEFARCKDGKYRMLSRDRREECVLISSERLTDVREDWIQVPTNHILSMSESLNVRIEPIQLNYTNFTNINEFQDFQPSTHGRARSIPSRLCPIYPGVQICN
eukprot:1000268_1